MATSNVKNAMGVLQQFSKQPVSTYVRNLINVNTSTGAAEGQINRAQQLMTALSSVGDNLLAYGVGQEERKRTIADRANNLVNAATEEDWNKRSAIEILNQDSMSSQLVDNPYAIAIIEQGRGKYQNSKMNLAYQDVVNEQGRAKTVGEEIKRYEQFSHDWYKEHVGESYNDVSFNKGFYKDYNEDLNNQATSTALFISNNLKAQREGMMQADIGEAVSSIQDGKLTATDMPAHMSTLFHSATVAAMSLPDKIKLANGFVESLSQIGVDPSFLEEAKKIQIATLPDGGAILLGDVIDMNEYDRVNNIAIRQNQMLDYPTLKMKLLDCKTVADVDNFANGLSPSQWEYIRQDVLNRKYEIKIAEQRARERRAISAQKSKSALIGSRTFSNTCAAIIAGQRVPSSLGEIFVTDVNSSGETIKRSLTKEEAAQGLMEYLTRMNNDQSLSTDEKASRNNRLLSNPLVASVAGDIQSMWADSLATVSPNESMDSPHVRNIQMMMTMISKDYANAQRALSADNFKEAYAIKKLMDLKGDLPSAITAYATVRGRLRDPETKKIIDSQVDDALDTSISIPIGGGQGKSSVDLKGNMAIEGLARTAFTYYIGAGVSPDEAQNKVQEDFSKYYCVLPGDGMQVVPQALFGNIQVGDPFAVAQQFKEHEIQRWADASMESPTSLMWQWNEQENKYQLVDLNNLRVLSSYSISEFNAAVYDFAYEAGQNEKKAAEEKAAREEQAQESYTLAKNFTDDYMENSDTIMD